MCFSLLFISIFVMGFIYFVVMCITICKFISRCFRPEKHKYQLFSLTLHKDITIVACRLDKLLLGHAQCIYQYLERAQAMIATSMHPTSFYHPYILR